MKAAVYCGKSSEESGVSEGRIGGHATAQRVIDHASSAANQAGRRGSQRQTLTMSKNFILPVTQTATVEEVRQQRTGTALQTRRPYRLS